MRILLVSPSAANDIVTRTIRELPYLMSDAFFAPHACAAVAALTPPEHEVVIHDEHMHGPVEARLERERYDVVGISLIANQLNRTAAIAEFFRERELPGALVVGGMGTPNIYPRTYELVDAVFFGEAEQTWPRFLEQYARGAHQRRYRQVAKPDMSLVPIPRWKLIADDIPRYSSASVQTNRGCPFDCSFCDVIYTFGRKLRMKPVEQVLEEIQILERLGTKIIYFADDCFTADRSYVKDLLRRLVELNRSFEIQMGFMTQVDITVADDDELLQLMLDANVVELQIGIESVNEASLKEFNKRQNLRFDAVEAVRKIQSYGMMVLAHMIVGADADDASCFEHVGQFLQDAHIIHHQCHPLMAPPGTKLWYDLKRQGRVVQDSDEARDQLDVTTNIIPKQMTRVELTEGLADHWERVTQPALYHERVLGFLQGIEHKPSFEITNAASPWRMRRIMFEMLKFFGFRAERAQRRLFFQLLNETRKLDRELIPKMIYVHTFYMLEYVQAKLQAAQAREQAAWERQLPNGVPTEPVSVPLTPAVRAAAKKIFAAAYRRVRERIGERDALYRVVLEATIDYTDRFGESFDGFDDYQLDAVQKSCDRIMDQRQLEPADAHGKLPTGRPPPGFTREMLDALDQAIRVRGYLDGVQYPGEA